MKINLKNGTVVISGKNIRADVLISGNKIERIAQIVDEKDATVIDCTDRVIMPGFVDMHCHLREPGYEYKEDIASGTAAAVKGGFTSVCCMPNTLPVIDNAPLVRFIKLRASEVGKAKVYPIGCITKGQNGQEITEFGDMQQAGAVAVSDDGKPVENGNIMRLALEYAKSFHMPVVSHCEELAIASDGVVNEGANATIAGLKGINPVAEEAMVAREILLASSLHCPVHIAHISTKNSVALVRFGKAQGIAVTAETCPHYFSGDDTMILAFDTNAKVNPPLRTKEDVSAIIAGLADGTIDAIATDHAPHHENEKNVEFNYAANGISGLETAFALSYTNLVRTGVLTLNELSAVMSENPARIFHLGSGILGEGEIADITVVDLKEPFKIDKNTFVSKGKNTPFHGQEVYGKVCLTLVNGQIVYALK